MDDKDLPIDKRNGKPHVGSKNLKSFKPGESGNPKGRPVGSLGKKNRFKKDLLVLKWMAEDPELAELVASMDNVDMFDALKNTAFAMYANDPTDLTKYDRAYKAVAEDREYTEGKKVRQEIDSRVTQVSEMSIEELEAQLADLDIDDVEPEED
jgi:hypothetical protein